jgi:hypothetical protein
MRKRSHSCTKDEYKYRRCFLQFYAFWFYVRKKKMRMEAAWMKEIVQFAKQQQSCELKPVAA